ncbi:MAG TPA: hypothetical protein VFZ52_12730 [Chryseolinea sp.]
MKPRQILLKEDFPIARGTAANKFRVEKKATMDFVSARGAPGKAAVEGGLI